MVDLKKVGLFIAASLAFLAVLVLVASNSPWEKWQVERSKTLWVRDSGQIEALLNPYRLRVQEESGAWIIFQENKEAEVARARGEQGWQEARNAAGPLSILRTNETSIIVAKLSQKQALTLSRMERAGREFGMNSPLGVAQLDEEQFFRKGGISGEMIAVGLLMLALLYMLWVFVSAWRRS